jgi:hypothetical protein
MKVARFLCVLLIATSSGAAEVPRAGRWELHSSFWMNLHQTLMHDATARESRDLAALGPDERAAWVEAVAAYKAAAGRGNITFSSPMMDVQDELTQVADDAVKIGIAGPVADALRKAAPVYRARWWAADDAANRFFIGYAAAMLRDGGEELVRAHETVYGMQFPKKIRLDVAAYAGPFGAYSHSLVEGGFTTTISSRDAGYQGLSALEMILHEASHSVVGPRNGTVARAIAAAAAKAGIEPPRDLWHAILFATSSELARRALEQRGAAAFTPSTEDMFTRVWPKYRKPIETFWYPYLSGAGTLDEAIGKIVAALGSG